MEEKMEKGRTWSYSHFLADMWPMDGLRPDMTGFDSKQKLTNNTTHCANSVAFLSSSFLEMANSSPSDTAAAFHSTVWIFSCVNWMMLAFSISNFWCGLVKTEGGVQSQHDLVGMMNDSSCCTWKTSFNVLVRFHVRARSFTKRRFVIVDH